MLKSLNINYLSWSLFVALLLLVVTLPVVEAAEEKGEWVAAKDEYVHYCSACHGFEGKGDGMVAGVLTVKPTDLTQLSHNNNGSFPYMKVRAIIDGRAYPGESNPIRAHGPAEMPVWGAEFQGETGNEYVTKGRILAIVDYLNSIQE